MARRPSFKRGPSDIKRGTVGNWPQDKPSHQQVAERAFYVASGLHKSHPSPDGLWTVSSRRVDKSKCPKIPVAEWSKLQDVLRRAIQASCVDVEFRGDFPARAWVRLNGGWYEARLTNEGTGEYHGFPIAPEQLPRDPHKLLLRTPNVEIDFD